MGRSPFTYCMITCSGTARKEKRSLLYTVSGNKGNPRWANYFVTEFLNKVKSCELEQLTDGLETQLSVVLYMNSNKVAVKEADCALADLPQAWQDGSLVFIASLRHNWHSTCYSGGNVGDNKTSSWKALQKLCFPLIDWSQTDYSTTIS